MKNECRPQASAQRASTTAGTDGSFRHHRRRSGWAALVGYSSWLQHRQGGRIPSGTQPRGAARPHDRLCGTVRYSRRSTAATTGRPTTRALEFRPAEDLGSSRAFISWKYWGMPNTDSGRDSGTGGNANTRPSCSARQISIATDGTRITLELGDGSAGGGIWSKVGLVGWYSQRGRRDRCIWGRSGRATTAHLHKVRTPLPGEPRIAHGRLDTSVWMRQRAVPTLHRRHRPVTSRHRLGPQACAAIRRGGRGRLLGGGGLTVGLGGWR